MQEVKTFTKFDEKHCHKWAILLKERKKKIDRASVAIASGDFDTAKKLTSEVFHGGSSVGKHADPGMEGSLLYHTAMVTKMAAEPRLVLEELKVEVPNVDRQLWRFYSDFASDVSELAENTLPLEVNPRGVIEKGVLGVNERINLFRRLTKRTDKVEDMLNKKDIRTKEELQDLFREWANHIVNVRLRQEYETIKGFLIMVQLAEDVEIERLKKAMSRVQKKFGEETVKAALNVTLKVGKERKDLDAVMLSDHFIEREMDMAKLEGVIRFLNCPIFGSKSYVADELDVRDDITSFFCRYFCYAHAKAMLETVLPFAFELSQSRRMVGDGRCEFLLELARAPAGTAAKEKYIPLVVSWNVTLKCNLKCLHCYINAAEKKLPDDLSTDAAKMLIHQIAEVSRPLLILSGGEPLLRADILELIQYGTERGLKMAMGSNGMLIDDKIARKLKEAGIKTVSISLDSSTSERHDEFRGVKGSWGHAIRAIKALRNNDILLQVNTTVTKQNYDEIDDIMTLVEALGVENFHLFFLVPTGRGVKIDDISPIMYENKIRGTFAKIARHKLNVKPSCAPQFMRIAKQMGASTRHIQAKMRGCIAGLYYCRIYPTGEVTPCPYLPIKLGNIRERSFKDIWFNSEILKNLRDFNKLQGKCGVCKYRDICGGCRARAYGLTSDFIDHCGDLHEPTELRGNYLAEEPWCVYQPKAFAIQKS